MYARQNFSTGPVSFDAWMEDVDSTCQRLCGCSVHDLEDCCFNDWFEDGLTPREAAKAAIRNSDGPPSD